MRAVLFLLIVLGSTTVKAQDNPFAKLDYDRVVAYEFQGMGMQLIEKCLEEAPQKINKELELSPAQVSKLEGIITAKTAYGSTTAACFDPHFAVIYYKGEEIVATVDICLECNYLMASEEIPATSLKMIHPTEDFSYPAKGFSPETRKQLHTFVKSLGFTRYLRDLQSMFDD